MFFGKILDYGMIDHWILSKLMIPHYPSFYKGGSYSKMDTLYILLLIYYNIVYN